MKASDYEHNLSRNTNLCLLASLFDHFKIQICCRKLLSLTIKRKKTKTLKSGGCMASVALSVPCSGSFRVDRRSSSSHPNHWGSGSGSCSGPIGGNRLHFWSRGTRPPDRTSSSAHRVRWGSASSRRSAAAPRSSPSCPHKEPPRANRSPPPLRENPPQKK